MLTRPSGSQADDLFHALVENSSDAIALLDANGVIRFASRSSARVLGYALEERLGRSGFTIAFRIEQYDFNSGKTLPDGLAEFLGVEVG